MNIRLGRRVVKTMRAKILKIRVLLMVVIAAAAVFAQSGSPLTNPSVRSPVGTGTTPVTAYRSGLVASPNPIDRTSDLVITGNVGGGKHFRGLLPYNAVSDFGGTLGSGELDDFLRYSTVPQNYYSGGVAPFYSQTGTVTRVVPGTNMVIIPPSSKIRTPSDESLERNLIPADLGQIETTQRTNLPNLARVGFLPVSAEQLEQYLSLGEEDQAGKEKAGDEYQREQKQFAEQLKGLREDVDKFQHKLAGASETVKPSSNVPESDVLFRQELETTEKPPSPLEPAQVSPPMSVPEQKQPPQKVDIYEKMLAEYEEAQKAYKELFPDTNGPEERADSNQTMPAAKPRKLEYEQQIGITPPAKESPQPAPEEPATELEILARTRRILSEQQTFAVYSQDKFNQYMRAAEQCMKQGKFYLAADAYSLASVYKPLDPLAYAGKSHALLAAGDYLSSALNLSQAIEMFPGYVDFKVDIVAMIGDMDTVEKRIADIKAWIEVSSAPELQFLLAYVYMQLDRLDNASAAANAAYERMPDVPAVGLLKTAIEQRRSSR